MALFLDTSKINEIEKYHKMGLIRGVTTNPTIMLKEGITGGLEGIKAADRQNCPNDRSLSGFGGGDHKRSHGNARTGARICPMGG